MSTPEGAVTLLLVLGLLAVLSASEVLEVGGLAPASRRVLGRVTLPLFAAFCLVVGRQFVEFL